MNYFIGVSRNTSLLRLNVNSKSFWCIYDAYNAQIGDYLFMYFTVGAATINSGVAQIYVLTSDPRQNGEIDCSSRNMRHVDIELIANITKHITIKEMKENEILKEWGAVRRSMQGVVFNMDHNIATNLLSIITSKNPDLEGIVTHLESKDK